MCVKDAQRIEKSEVEVEDITIRVDLIDLTEDFRSEKSMSQWLEGRRWCVTVEP